jgi:methylmalonyl-CoA mutase cobalamin-binding subunit
MAEALLAHYGCTCFSLRVETPVSEIVMAASVQNTDIVALSFSSGLNPAHVTGSLVDLRRALPPTIEIWAGGTNRALTQFTAPGILIYQQLSSISDAMNSWHKRHTERLEMTASKP